MWSAVHNLYCLYGVLTYCQRFAQHYIPLWCGNYCAYKLHIDKVMLVKARGSVNYGTPCRSRFFETLIHLDKTNVTANCFKWELSITCVSPCICHVTLFPPIVLRSFHCVASQSAIPVYRARRSEARIQQMLWKVNYSDIVFVNTVCITLLGLSAIVWLSLRSCHVVLNMLILSLS